MAKTKTSVSVKERYNSKSYDDVRIRLPKGRKADVEEHAQQKGLSVNGLVNDLLAFDLGLSVEQWKAKDEHPTQEHAE